ncbi:MAG: amidohydrolase family protein [Balneolaceae bacterium]|nr:amidohydrolase family protein [Balneolaceae bacterium]
MTVLNRPKPFSRKEFLKGTGAGLMMPFLTGFTSEPDEPIPENRRLLLKGGSILTMDDEIGDFRQADLLIEDGIIKEIATSIKTDAETVDASGRIIMPGFVDTHRHMWQGSIRNILPNGRLSDYMQIVQGKARPVFRPEDAYAGNLISSVGAIDTGITTVLDWSHISNSPDHTDAAIEALVDSGIRAVYAFGSGDSTPANRHPEDLRRLRNTYFSSDDSLISLALAAGINAKHWEIAREEKVRITLHVNGTGDLLPVQSHLVSCQV